MASDREFQRIVVPVDFHDASPEVIDAGKAIEVGNQLVDFAPASLRAVRLAAQIASGAGTDSRVLLLHVTPRLDYATMYTGPTGVRLPANVVEEIHERARETSLELLRLLASEHLADSNVDLVARAGAPLDVILEEASKFSADLIVMAASGRSRVARFFVGSTADRIIRQAGCPVLVVPAQSHN